MNLRRSEKERIITVPNVLSLLRIILVFPFLGLVFQQKFFQAFVVFLIAASTDLFDGMTARLWHQKSKLGSFLDPAGDKLLMVSTFIVLSFPSFGIPNTIPLWLTASVIGKDLWILIGACILISLRGQTSFLPSLLGKASTFLQMLFLIYVLFFNAFHNPAPNFNLFAFLTFLLTVISGIHYSVRGFRMAFSEKNKKKGLPG